MLLTGWINVTPDYNLLVVNREQDVEGSSGKVDRSTYCPIGVDKETVISRQLAVVVIPDDLIGGIDCVGISGGG